MGNALIPLGKACMAPCNDCAKYVCNAVTCHSKCCQLCELDVETHEIDVVATHSEESIDCCLGHAKHEH